MLPEKDRDALRDMLAHPEEVLQLSQDPESAELDRERVVYLAVQRLLEIVGEAANRVSAETRHHHPQIPWHSIIGMRNRVIHGYDAVNPNTVWRTATQNVAPLIEQLQAVLEEQTRPSDRDGSEDATHDT